MIRHEVLRSIKDENEKLAAAKAIDKLEIARKTFSPQFTVFMDPYKAYFINDILLNNDCFIMVYGGYADSERVKLGFFPEFTKPEESVFPISRVEVRYNANYSRTLSHRDFLGSILGLGITREKIGDIIIEEDRAVVFADSDIADYIAVNLEKVANTKVKAKIINSYAPKVKEALEKRITVASLRLDAVLSGALNISRGRVSELIKGDKAFVNWKKENSISCIVKEDDIITLRGMGRVKINEIMGNTKKDRVLINVSVYK